VPGGGIRSKGVGWAKNRGKGPGEDIRGNKSASSWKLEERVGQRRSWEGGDPKEVSVMNMTKIRHRDFRRGGENAAKVVDSTTWL